MKRNSLLLVLLLVSNVLYAQKNLTIDTNKIKLVETKRDEEILNLAAVKKASEKEFERQVFNCWTEEFPEFPGGEKELISFIKKNLIYPHVAFENKIEGRVIIGFKVNEDGGLSDLKILKGLGYGCDEEAIRIINIMPKWRPAKNNGKLVSIKYSIPFEFNIKSKFF